MFGLDLAAITGLVGIVFPPVVDIFKKIFVKKDKDSSEATMSALATTNPEALGPYVTALGELKKADVAWYNRDVAGEIPAWCAAWRACIRPFGLSMGFIHMFAAYFYGVALDEGVKAFYVLIISQWFGERLVLKGGK